MSRRAFTLLEVMGVLVLAGLLAGITAVSFKGALRTATLEEAGARVKWMDTLARSVARTTGQPVTLTFEGNHALRELGRTTNESTKESTTFDLPPGYRFADPTRIEIGPEGRSESYLLELIGPTQKTWIAIAGLTGEGVVTRDQSIANAVVAK